MWPPAGTGTINGVLAFYSLPAPLWASFCNAVGDPGNDVRVLAPMPSAMVAEATTACRMANGRRLTAVEAIQGEGLRACRPRVPARRGE